MPAELVSASLMLLLDSLDPRLEEQQSFVPNISTYLFRILHFSLNI